MRFNNLSVRVVGGREIEGGYVEMHHGQQYSLVLRNENPRRYNASVRIDGQEIGAWRLNAYDSATLTYAPDDPQHGKFTFYKLGTQEARQVGLAYGDDNIGLITVVFTPELTPTYRATFTAATPYSVPDATVKGLEMSSSSTSSTVTRGYSSGGTGLSGHSSQQYGTASNMELDYGSQTTINLRLIGVRDDNTPRSLAPFSTPVPPAIR